ncbi:tetratricopeptide repeat protein [Maribellus maritimus]|uniref:tetratricopeptide repeat protein n=1 Tax=Maribellus maritimus TaxID=2870838 RepID=UPI001EEBF24E|nr:tetratricopeptide repeat protein [Maribellus maritimus]MCG6187434.1 phospholipid carrier-dependent glycosyltransferase [Maribellus maritimus]
MTKELNIVQSKNVFFAILLLVAVVLVILAPRAAVNVDEQLHYPHAKKVVNWYFTGGKDKSCLDTPITNLKYYGQSVDNFTALVNRVFHFENEFLIRHYTGAFFFLLLCFFSGLVSHQLTNSYWISSVTVLVLVFMPRLFGQAFGNLKDIPFAAGYIAGVYLIIRYLKELPRPGWKTAVLLGTAIAFTCSVRIGGLILFGYLGLFGVLYFILKPFELKHIVSTRPCFVRLTGQLIVIVIIGYFAGLLFWPYALQNVFKNPFESLGVMEHYKVSIRQIFEGDVMWSTQLPWYYWPKWLLISTPEFIFLGLFSYLFLLFKSVFQQNVQGVLYESFLIFSFLFPIVYVLLIKSNLYSGVRQLFFVLPSLAIISSLGIHRFFKLKIKPSYRYAGTTLFFLLMLLPFRHQAKTFPVDYIYFNSFSGGNKNAWSNYEYDYYFHGLKEPAGLLKEMTGENKIIVASNCNLSNYFDDLPNVKYRYVKYLERSSYNWDYGIFGINYIHPYLLKNDKWQSTTALKTFYHKGNPIAVLLIRKSKDDYYGIAELEKGNYVEAEHELIRSLDEDPQNVWLMVQLAKIYLLKGDWENFNKYVQKGREIYPLYEPFYLLEAQKLYNENNFRASYAKLEELIQINRRYKPAKLLLQEVKDKLDIN